jgi:hypothetical protein
MPSLARRFSCRAKDVISVLNTQAQKSRFSIKKNDFFLSTSDLDVYLMKVPFVPSSNELAVCMKSIGQSAYHQAWQGMHKNLDY